MAASIPSTMRASQWTSIPNSIEKSLKVNNNAALPKSAKSLGKDDTLVKVHYVALNPVDYKLPEAPIVGRIAISKPASPCMDFAGVVVKTSRSDLRPGQAVFGKTEPPLFGAMAEYLVAGRQGTIALPDGVKPEDAACVGVAGLTAYQCIAPNVKSGDKIFINGGSGGTGSFGIQFAKALGCEVTTTCSGPNVELCKSLGADEVIDYRTQNVHETLKRSGKQFDHIVDFVGSPELYWQAHDFSKKEAKVVNVGATMSLDFFRRLLPIFILPGFLGGGKMKYEFLTCRAKEDDFKQIAKWMAEGKVKPVIGEMFSLEEVPKAFEKLKTGRVRGKLVVKVSNQ
ncbi:NAD(P)-binding protein [Aureobasidium subglaciale]|nr:NAD(P)-binding protein [Aureobasidium subglaciale]